jgi:type II secretory pathway component GspD/PulD (secretin)
VVSNLQTGMPASAPPPVPVFRNFSATTALDVWDGQTVLLGGPMQEGDSSQPQSTNSQRANFMVFITARIIDPAGNPVHTEEDMPFVKESIPPQTPGNGVPK